MVIVPLSPSLVLVDAPDAPVATAERLARRTQDPTTAVTFLLSLLERAERPVSPALPRSRRPRLRGRNTVIGSPLLAKWDVGLREMSLPGAGGRTSILLPLVLDSRCSACVPELNRYCGWRGAGRAADVNRSERRVPHRRVHVQRWTSPCPRCNVSIGVNVTSLGERVKGYGDLDKQVDPSGGSPVTVSTFRSGLSPNRGISCLSTTRPWPKASSRTARLLVVQEGSAISSRLSTRRQPE
jgi:hypothetical protein